MDIELKPESNTKFFYGDGTDRQIEFEIDAAGKVTKAWFLNTGQKDAGTRELRALIARYPRSLEAQQAKDRLRQLGAAPTASKPSPGRRRE